MRYALILLLINLFPLQIYAAEGTTFLSCKGGWNNPTWWRHAWIELKGVNGAKTMRDLLMTLSGTTEYLGHTLR